MVFRVQPEDASVWLHVDQERHLLEPVAGSLTATLAAGAHLAEVEREGYASREIELEVKGGETRTVDVCRKSVYHWHFRDHLGGRMSR